MKNIHDYIAEQFIGNTYHFKCDCLMPLDFIGRVVDWSLAGQEILLHIDTAKKIIKLGINHPNLTIEKLNM